MSQTPGLLDSLSMLKEILWATRVDIAERVFNRGLTGSQFVTIVSEGLGMERVWYESPIQFTCRVAIATGWSIEAD